MTVYKKPNEEQIKETYLKYIECFRRHDFEKIKEYLADTLYFYWGSCAPPIIGKDAFIDYFKTAAEYWDEQPMERIENVTIPILRAWIDNTITVNRDWENSPFEVFGMEPKAGDVYTSSGYVNYVFNEDGQIAIIIDLEY